jgi:hypothetical protein
MTSLTVAPTTTPAGHGRAGVPALNVAAPVATYYLLHSTGWSDLAAPTAAALVPLAGCVPTAVRTRCVDAGAVRARRS